MSVVDWEGHLLTQTGLLDHYPVVPSLLPSPSLLLSFPQGTKAVMKDIAKYLPGIGWTFLFMEYPFLKRDWKSDEELLKNACKNLSDYPVHMLVRKQDLASA